jgi:hypothetical protein
MSEKLTKQLRHEIRAFIEDEVMAGFEPPAEIVESVICVFADDASEGTLHPLAEKLVGRAIEEHMEAQAEWPEVTDNDRLDAAFAELEEQYGILARQNYSDCLTGGHAELQAEVAQAREQGCKIRGYTFYHAQDTGFVVESGILPLAFGTLATDEVVVRAMLSPHLENDGATLPDDPEQPLAFKPEVMVKLQEIEPDLPSKFSFGKLSAAFLPLLKAMPYLERLGMLGNSSQAELAVFKVANDVVDVLRRHGLDASWEGLSERRIEVRMDWKRRR